MKKIFILLLGALSLPPSECFAQSDSIKILQMDSIVISSVRGDSKTPVSYSMLRKGDIERSYQGQEIPILLDRMTSVTSTSDGGHPQGYTYFRIRGIDQTRINMTLNGIPLNEPEDQGVYTSNYPGFANLIQSVQIQRGVGVSTNGVASYGGSISFQSKSGVEKETDMSIGYGSFNTVRVNISNSTGSKNGFSLFSNLSAYSSEGYRIGSGGNGYSVFLSGSFYKNDNIFKFTSFLGRSFNGIAWLATNDHDIRVNPKTNYNKNDAWDMFTQSLYNIQWNKTLNNKSNLTTSFFYNRLDGSFDYFMSGNRSLFLKSNFYGLISNYQYNTPNFKLNIGINLSDYNRTHENKEAFYINTGYRGEISSFIKTSYDYNKFNFYSDFHLRHTNFRYKGNVYMDKINWLFFNPKFGITFNQNKLVKYYVSVGRTSREPTRTDLFMGNNNLDTSKLDNLNLPAESVIDFELGVNIKKQRWNLKANIYYMSFENEITLLGAIGSNSLPLMTSVRKSFRSGIEGEINYHSAFNLFNSTTSFNLSYNRINDGGKKFEPLLTPSVNIFQNIYFQYSGVIFGLNGRWYSKSYVSLDNLYSIPGFFLLGMDLSYTRRGWTYMLQGNNLLNSVYYNRGYAIDNKGPLKSDGRYLYTNPLSTFYLTIKRKIK